MVDAVHYANENTHRVGCIAKAGRVATTNVSNIHGVQCTIVGYARSAFGKLQKSVNNNVGSKNAPKLTAIQAAVGGLVGKGYQLPDITFHLSEYAQGWDQAITAAWPYAVDGTQSVEIMLGVNSLYSPAPGREGIAHLVEQAGTGSYTECVAVHEIGHMLHAILSPDLFYTVGGQSDAANATVALEDLNSPYATTNNKEIVAETFAANYFNIAISTRLSNIYAALGGPPLR